MPKGGNGNANGHGSEFLALAFMDAGGSDKFEPKKGDALIAGLIDTNGDNVVSVGDTITYGDYFNFASEKVGEFTAPDYVIQPGDTIEIDAALNAVAVTIFSGDEFAEGIVRWVDHDAVEGFSTIGINPNFGFESHFIDSIASGDEDALLADPAIDNPAHPDTLIEPTFGAIANGDQGFIDVFVV